MTEEKTLRKTSVGKDAEILKPRTDSFVTNSTNQPTVPTNSTNQPTGEPSILPAEYPPEPAHQKQIIAEQEKPVIELKTFREAVRAIEYVIDITTKILGEASDSWKKKTDAELYQANAVPKWWHLYKHSKKMRTRKKYRRLIIGQLIIQTQIQKALEVSE